jgi:hypothetical protein
MLASCADHDPTSCTLSRPACLNNTHFHMHCSLSCPACCARLQLATIPCLAGKSGTISKRGCQQVEVKADTQALSMIAHALWCPAATRWTACVTQAMLDANGDGQVTENELVAAVQDCLAVVRADVTAQDQIAALRRVSSLLRASKAS